VKTFLIATLLLVSTLGTGLAQTAGPFAPRHPDSAAAETAPAEPGLFGRAIAAILQAQRQFHRKLAAALERIRDTGATAAAWTLILTSFLYGVLHAAGPGHGKAILTTYLATHRERMPRGILLAAAAAGMQGLVAILLVFGLTMLAGRAARDAQSAAHWAEQFSFALVALLGGYLLFKAARGLWRTFIVAGHHHHGHGHGHGHDHHDHDGHDHHDHDHCGHAHMPTPDQMDAARDFRTMAGVVLSIGIRPCSGAVLVLAVANLFGIAWAGLAAVAAMSFGTALAVATLALVVLSARRIVTTLIQVEDKALAVTGQIVAFVGGGLILVLGVTLLLGSFGPAHPLGL
jgi:nickel/cobalt transporter (NicO) family protein